MTANTTSLPRFRDMMRLHFGYVHRVVRHRGVRDGDVDDVMQRVFLIAYRRLSEIHIGTERAFLCGVALREAGHMRRWYGRCSERFEESWVSQREPGLAADERLHVRQMLAHVQAIVASMPPNLQAVFMLCQVEQLSGEEVARELGIPLGTVKSRLRRAHSAFTRSARKHYRD